jgi:hypothetical protein
MPEHEMRREPAHFFECAQDAVPLGPETSAELSTAGGVVYAPTLCDGTLDRLRRALSQRAFEIMRECDLGLRIRTRCGGETRRCRILYLTEPELRLLR